MPPFQFEYDSICKVCMLGKNIKKYFPSSYKRSKEVLDLIHLDVCGPMSTPSMNGYLYYAIFIDDLSRKTWIYFMKAKNETFNKFQEFKEMIENQTGKHIKTLRSNNVVEFKSNHFEYFCKEARIKRQLTVPYNPQQNGVAERKNKAICEVAKAMLHDLNSLPLYGKKLQEQWCIFRTGALMLFWERKLQRKHLQERNQM